MWKAQQAKEIIRFQTSQGLVCLRPVKRKAINFMNVKWAYHLEGTNFYLVCKVTKVYFKWNKKYYNTKYVWSWVQVKRDYCGNVLSWREITPDMILTGKVPKNLLFNLDIFEKIIKAMSND
jgi:hypothetical protein